MMLYSRFCVDPKQRLGEDVTERAQTLLNRTSLIFIWKLYTPTKSIKHLAQSGKVTGHFLCRHLFLQLFSTIIWEYALIPDLSVLAEELLIAAASDIGKTVGDVRPYMLAGFIQRLLWGISSKASALAESCVGLMVALWIGMQWALIRCQPGHPAVSAPAAEQITGFTLRVDGV